MPCPHRCSVLGMRIILNRIPHHNLDLRRGLFFLSLINPCLRSISPPPPPPAYTSSPSLHSASQPPSQPPSSPPTTPPQRGKSSSISGFLAFNLHHHHRGGAAVAGSGRQGAAKEILLSTATPVDLSGASHRHRCHHLCHLHHSGH